MWRNTRENERADEIQSIINEVRPRVRRDYFDGSQPVSHWGTEDALTVLADVEAGRIDAAADTGLDAANQVLIGELFDYALRLFREEGDRSLFHRMENRVNDYFNREATIFSVAVSTPVNGIPGIPIIC